MLKFIHAADIHLDSPLKGLERYEGAPLEEVRGATRRALENLVALAIEEQAAFVLLAGDIYDGDWKDYNTGLFFIGQMARLQEAGIPVLMVAGNHDAASHISRSLRLPDNVHTFATRAPETRVLEELGVAVHGQGFATRAVSEDLSRGYPPPLAGLVNIGLLHTSLDGRPGHADYAPCSVEGLAGRGYQYWALGHVHRHEVVAEAPWIVYPGNLQGRHARETGPKGCCLVTLEEGGVSAVEHRALDVVRWMVEAVDLAGVVSIDGVYDRVARALEGAVGAAEGRLLALRLELAGACPVHGRLRAEREQVVQECRALAATVGADLWLEKVVLATREAVTADEAMARDDAFGGLLRAVRDLDLDEPALTALAAEVEDLAARLPAELRAGDEPFDPTEPALLREALEDVKALLVERLLGRGGGP